MKGEMKSCKKEQMAELKKQMDLTRAEIEKTRIMVLKDHESVENYRIIKQIYDEILRLRKKYDEPTLANGYLDDVVAEIESKWHTAQKVVK